jgi:ethanolamine utilization protein EutN
MKIGRVVGNVVATRKDERLVGYKLLILRILTPDDSGALRHSGERGGTIVAVDLVGAGVGEIVLFCSGSSARASTGNMQTPVDAAVVGIVDTVDIYGPEPAIPPQP